MNIQLKNICKSYGNKQVLRDFSAELQEGECTVIMGPSGCGKTTMLRILMGLEKPDKGFVEGIPKRVSAVFQEDRLCKDFSAADNVAMVMERPVFREVIQRHLERIGLTGNFDQPIGQFSGGMKRRVAIVRAVLARGDLLILDEPFQGLDQATKKRVIEYLKEENQGRTVLVVTHDREEAELMGTRLIQMENSKNR